MTIFKVGTLRPFWNFLSTPLKRFTLCNLLCDVFYAVFENAELYAKLTTFWKQKQEHFEKVSQGHFKTFTVQLEHFDIMHHYSNVDKENI